MIDDFVEFVAGKVQSFTRDEQVAGAVLRGRDALQSGRPNYFFLRDLTNPQSAYWSHKGYEFKPSDKLQAAFDYGNMMHRKAGYVLSSIDGFAGSEGALDGAAVGLPKIRGRADFRISESLVEFKTTSKKVDEADEVWSDAPQDIEQLLFYAGLWTGQALLHYLIYYTKDEANPIRVFQATISNIGDVRNTIRQRRDRLQSALDESDPSKLGRCRYFGNSCPFRDDSICSCGELEEISTSSLRKVVELERDTKMEETVAKAWETFGERPSRPLSPWELQVPRQAYGRLTGERPEELWVPPENWVWSALWQSDLLPGIAVAPMLPRIFDPLQFKASGMYIVRSVTGDEGAVDKVTPALIRNWKNDYVPRARYVKNQLMQLGVLCALSQKATGILLLDSPQIDGGLLVFAVTFKDLNEIKNTVKERLGDIALSVEKSDPALLPECPISIPRDACSNCLCR